MRAGEPWKYLNRKGKSGVPNKGQIVLFSMLLFGQNVCSQPFLAKPIQKESPQLQSETAAMDTASAHSVPAKTHTLFGRVEQLTTQSGAQFPLVAAPNANLGLEGQATNDGTLYTGKVVSSFPDNMQGLWSGTLRLMQCDLSAAARAKPQSQLCKVGMVGQTNIKFDRSSGRLKLSPVNIVFRTPVTNGLYSSLVGSPHAPQQSNQQSQQNQQKSFEFVISLGDIHGPTFAGGQIQAQTLSNSIREVATSAFEQDLLVAQSYAAPMQASETGYCENAIRFRRMSATQQYVEAVMVNYDDRRQFIAKMVFAGYIQKVRNR
jgi:hypothetical protein